MVGSRCPLLELVSFSNLLHIDKLGTFDHWICIDGGGLGVLCPCEGFSGLIRNKEAVDSNFNQRPLFLTFYAAFISFSFSISFSSQLSFVFLPLASLLEQVCCGVSVSFRGSISAPLLQL